MLGVVCVCACVCVCIHVHVCMRMCVCVSVHKLEIMFFLCKNMYGSVTVEGKGREQTSNKYYFCVHQVSLQSLVICIHDCGFLSVVQMLGR